jgi:hypothetical protein
MTEPRQRDIFDDTDTWWTIDETAEHFGLTRAAILRWIREGYIVPRGSEKLLHRPEVLAERRRRMQRQIATRASGTSPE